MSNDLVSHDPIVARNFVLELDGKDTILLTGIDGFDMEMNVVEVNQNLPDGKQVHTKTLGGTTLVSNVTLHRLAPIDVGADPVWKWFNGIRGGGSNGGMKATNRAEHRKSGSIVLKDAVGTELVRYNFFHAWPSKITTSSMETGSTDPMKEDITLVCERMDRVK